MLNKVFFLCRYRMVENKSIFQIILNGRVYFPFHISKYLIHDDLVWFYFILFNVDKEMKVLKRIQYVQC